MDGSFLTRLTFAAVHGSIYVCFIWGVMLIFRGMPARWKCWLWRSVSVKLLMAMSIIVSLPVVVGPPRADAGATSKVTHAVLASLPPATAANIPDTQAKEPLQSVTPTQTISTTMVILGVWLLGVAIVLGRNLYGWSRMRRLLDRSVGKQITELPAETQKVLARSGYWVAVRLKSLVDLPAPALAGLIEPTILLPAEYEDSSPEALSTALAHELAHLRRRDPLWVLLAAITSAIFWFNPLVWVAYREQRVEAEIAADQLARKWTETSPKNYAQHLLEWIAPNPSDRGFVTPSAGMLLYTHELTRRMKAMQLKHYTRRSTLALGGLLLVPLGFGLAPISLVRIGGNGLAGSAWPKFRGGLNNSGLGTGPTAMGQKKWAFKGGGGFDSSPSIGPDGTLYVGSYDQNVYAIDGETGAKKWAFKTGGSVQSSPAVGTNGVIYVGSWDGWVYAIEAATGVQKWTFKTGDGVYGSPTIGADGTVYVGSEDTMFYALDGATGEKKWSYKTGDIICSTPAIGADGTVYFGSNDNCVYALDGATGVKKWAYNTGGVVVSSPALGPDGTVYVGCWDNTVFALDGTTGKSKWAFKTGGCVKASPAVGPDGTVYVGCFDHNFYAIDPTKGTKKWMFTSKDGFNSSAAITTDGTVYVGAWDHNLYALDASTGAKKWMFKTGDSVGCSPTIGSDGTVYLDSGDKFVYALK